MRCSLRLMPSTVATGPVSHGSTMPLPWARRLAVTEAASRFSNCTLAAEDFVLEGLVTCWGGFG